MLLIGLLIGTPACAEECFGEGDYRVCTDSYEDPQGNSHVRSWDTEGNTYGISTESYDTPSGSTIRSYDTEGNEYSIRSWSDEIGHHSEDSEGNRCTITHSGQMIGCN
jgi:hypothetical protein